MKRALLWAPLGSIALLIVIFAIALLAPAPRESDPLRDAPLPALPLEAFAGPYPGFETDGIEGPYLLNVWASWCPPCRVEHPFLMELSEDAKPIYGVVYKDDPGDAIGFLNELGNPFTALMADPDGRAGLELGITGAPETFLVDEAGIVRARWRGALSEPVWNQHFEAEWQAARQRASAP